ncbi:MAG: hypothetical protein RIB67_04190 [Miltoncostaeaceae bacterium]
MLAVAAICAGVLAAISGAEQPATESTAVEPPAWFPKEAASILEATDPSTARDLGSTDAGERVITVSRPGGDRCLSVVDADLTGPAAGSSMACYPPGGTEQDPMTIWRQNADRSLTFWAVPPEGTQTLQMGTETSTVTQTFVSGVIEEAGDRVVLVTEGDRITLPTPPIR